MSKVIVILYSFLILIQNFNINIEDISKLSLLLEHAKYHKEVYGDNFFEFISEHYGEKMASHQNKHEGHDKLPFKDNHHLCSHANACFILFPPLSHPLYSLALIEAPLDFFYKDSFSFFEKSSVFQPPKIA